MISEGLVDRQVNGFAGVDCNAGAFAPGDLPRAREALLATGVTCLLPTLITAAEPLLDARFRTLDAAIRNLIAWRIATPADAIAMASTRPAAVLAPALAARGISCQPGTMIRRFSVS